MQPDPCSKGRSKVEAMLANTSVRTNIWLKHNLCSQPSPQISNCVTERSMLTNYGMCC